MFRVRAGQSLGNADRFRMEDDVCRASYTVPPEQCGYTGVAHGGILYSLLDDVMANWLYLQGERAVTGRCEVRYRTQTPVNTRLELEGRMLKRRGRHVTMSGLVLDAATGETIRRGNGRFPGDTAGKLLMQVIGRPMQKPCRDSAGRPDNAQGAS